MSIAFGRDAKIRTMPVTPILLLTKAAMSGGAAADLFAVTVPVAGHTTSTGTYVAPYQALRRKHVAAAVPRPNRRPIGDVQGTPVEFPDVEHLALYLLGSLIVDGRPPPPGAAQRLWQHFRGFVAHDPDVGQPFGKPHDVLLLATDYAEECRDALASGRVVDPAMLDGYIDTYGLPSMAKALAAGERWITVRPNGPGTTGHPLLIKPASDGSYKVIGGAGGSMNHLRMTGVRSVEHYKDQARESVKRRKLERSRQTERDKADGLHGNKTAARDAIRSQKREQRAQYVKKVAAELGWKPEDMRFPAEKFANLSPDAQGKAEADHHRKLYAQVEAAVGFQQKRLVEDADLRAEGGLGEVPMAANKPEELSVQDLAPIQQSTTGLGFAPAYDKRAEAAGLTKPERDKEAESFKPPPDVPRPAGAASPAERRLAMGAAIADELKTVQGAGPGVDPTVLVDAKAAVRMLKARKAFQASQRSAQAAQKQVDAAKEPVEPKAYLLEEVGAMPDSAITKDLENDLRTLRTRAFLDEVGKLPGGEASVGQHIGVGAYNAVNAVALAAGGAALLDRSTVDVLGVAGAADVLARRLTTDLTPDEVGHVRDAMKAFHIDHYMKASDAALREARDLHEMAHEIELGDAANGSDLAAAQELNARRRQFTAAAERVLGTALGEMEANAALVAALETPRKEKIDVSLGRVSIEAAITRVRALGLERGQYTIEKIGASTFLSVTGEGMDKLARPVAKADLERTRGALAIINGDQDEKGWLPIGVTRRAEAAMNAVPGVAPRLAEPFRMGKAGPDAAVADYIGGRAADGDAPADIVAGLLAEDVMRQVGDRSAYMAAVDKVCPLYDADGNLVRAETHAAAFEAMADRFTESRFGGKLQPMHRQQFPVDHIAVNSLHEALAAHPEGIAAFKPVGDLTPQDQGALRAAFAEEYGKADPKAAAAQASLASLDQAEPPATVADMFGEGPNPAHAEWKAERDGVAADLNAASMTWGKYLGVMGSPANAYRAMQDVVRSKVLKRFADGQNRARPDAALKVGRAVIAHDLNHLDALDPEAREKRLTQQRALVDGLRSRKAGKYAAGTVAEKLDATRAHEEAFGQAQMGLFGAADPPGDDEGAKEPPPPAMGERYTIGHAAERQVADMMPLVGQNFRPGQRPEMWAPSMDGKYIGRQRAVKLIEHNGRTMLGMGVGSGKTAIALSSFTHLHGKGKATRGLFAVPSIVQGQFHGEALTLLEPGKYNWHCNPGASRAERIAAYKNPNLHFNVVTHQALRDDMLHLASKQQDTTTDAIAEKLDAMKPAERQAFMRDVMDKEGITHDFLAVDEGHSLLNRKGKENSRMANTIDGMAHGMRTYVSMTADPVKNDASEAFDVLAKMDPERYDDRDAFLRRYGVDTPAAKEELKREMARHFYTGKIDPGVKATRSTITVPLSAAQHTELAGLDTAAAQARLARMKGQTDIPALRTLSPSSFDGVDPARHEDVAKNLNRSIGILHNSALHHALSGESKTDALAKVASDRKGKPGVVFAHHIDRVQEISRRLTAEGHRVVTLTGSDSSAEKDRKKSEYQNGRHDIIVMSDAGAVGANLQRGQWLAQYDVPQTAMVHAQRQGRINRVGQKNDVELIDLHADHPAERQNMKRLAEKYELRDIMTSPLEGLDDSGVAGYLKRARAGALEAAEPLHPATPAEASSYPAPVEDEQQSMF